MPRLTQIAHLDLEPDFRAHLLPGTVIWYGFYGPEDMVVFRVWDYRLNHSISFSVDVEIHKFYSNIVVYSIF